MPSKSHQCGVILVAQEMQIVCNESNKSSTKTEAELGSPTREAQAKVSTLQVVALFVHMVVVLSLVQRTAILKETSEEIWLILPVVICLFQGLSHANVRVLADYAERSVYGSLDGLLSTQRRSALCSSDGITISK